jgi:hypothetical protein
MDRCDICGKETYDLVDYFCIVCKDCKKNHTDVVLLKRIAKLLNTFVFLEANGTIDRKIMKELSK